MEQTTAYPEKDLLQQIANGDEIAFRKLFNEHWQNVYGVAYMLTKSAPLAEDMVQEIFLKVWMKREQLPQVANFRNFLFIVARNHVFTELRKKSKELPFTEQLVDYFTESRKDPEWQLVHKQATELMQQAIGKLPHLQKQVYELSRNQGLTREQIAAQLGISPNTVRNHMARALELIRQYLLQHTSGLVLWICILDAFLGL